MYVDSTLQCDGIWKWDLWGFVEVIMVRSSGEDPRKLALSLPTHAQRILVNTQQDGDNLQTKESSE